MGEMRRPTRDGPREPGRGHTTMERRKFVVGLGALASGSAAAMGTGAFTSVTANRDVDVTVEGDASAYLGLEPASGPNGAYAEDNNDQVSVNFNDISDGNSSSEPSPVGNGTGVNPNATTNIDDVLTIRNQGTQEVTVSLNTNGLDSAVTAELEPDAPDYDLSPGDSVNVDFEIDSTGGYTPSESQTLTINADA